MYNKCVVFLRKRLSILDLFEGHSSGRSGHIFGASASPRPLTKYVAMSPSSVVHGGQYDTKCVTLEWLLHAAFMADEIWGDMLCPAHRIVQPTAVPGTGTSLQQ
ncbi:unnamed protein product [Laminaria digitata]